MTELGEFGMYLAIAVTMGSFFGVTAPVFKALAKRLEGRSASDDARIAMLEARLDSMEGRALTSGEVDNQFVRIAELEERLDFAERLLTQRSEGAVGGESSR